MEYADYYEIEIDARDAAKLEEAVISNGGEYDYSAPDYNGYAVYSFKAKKNDAGVWEIYDRRVDGSPTLSYILGENGIFAYPGMRFTPYDGDEGCAYTVDAFTSFFDAGAENIEIVLPDVEAVLTRGDCEYRIRAVMTDGIRVTAHRHEE